MSFSLHEIESLHGGTWAPRFQEPERLPIDALVAWDSVDETWVWWAGPSPDHYGTATTLEEAKRLAEQHLQQQNPGAPP